MGTAASINESMVLKTMCFEHALVLADDGDEPIAGIGDFARVHLLLGLPAASENRSRVHFDQSRRAVRQALNDAIRIARTIETTATDDATLDDHRAIFESIRAFASRCGALWGVTIPDPLPRREEARRVGGSMLNWYQELLTLLDVYELLSVATGKRVDRALRNRIRYGGDAGEVAIFMTRAGEGIGLATRDQRILVQPPWEPKPQTVEPWRLAHGDSRSLAWVIMTTICKLKLDHRINIGFHASERNSLAITPDGIGPTLFARLWLDALKQEANLEMVRQCQRPGCEARIPEGARADAQYCGNTCQKADRRRLQRLAQAHF